MNNGLLQALMMGAMGGGGAGMPGVGSGLPMPGAGAGMGAGGMLGEGGLSPQLMQFAAGAIGGGGGFQGGVGKLMGGLLAQKMKQRMGQRLPGSNLSGNPLESLLSGDPGSGVQPIG